MKIAKKTETGETKELLLKEYFLNAYLIAMLKAAGEEVGKFTRRREVEDLEPAPIRVR